MADFGRPWALCGGWGVDAWLGRRTRDHRDLDLAILDEDQLALHRYLRDGWLLNGHDPHDDDSTHPWDGHRLELPAHVHARAEGFELDFQVNRREGDDWILEFEPPLAVPIARAIRESPWGVPALAPELILFYKARGSLRPHDEADFEALAPSLGRAERAWLRTAIDAVEPGHGWVRRLV